MWSVSPPWGGCLTPRLLVPLDALQIKAGGAFFKHVCEVASALDSS